MSFVLPQHFLARRHLSPRKGLVCRHRSIIASFPLFPPPFIECQQWTATWTAASAPIRTSMPRSSRKKAASSTSALTRATSSTSSEMCSNVPQVACCTSATQTAAHEFTETATLQSVCSAGECMAPCQRSSSRTALAPGGFPSSACSF